MARADGAPRAPVPRGLFAALACGAALTFLAALPYPTFDLERHAVPKELALVATAALAAFLLVRRARVVRLGWAELALAAYGVWTVVSFLAAERWWPGLRATEVTLGGLAAFAAGSALGRAGRGRLLAGALVVAALAGVVTALAQAYGVDSPLFSRARAPGGLFGNRNFMAHAAAAALTLLVPLLLRARGAAFAAALAAAPVLAAGIVLSRSRAAWVATAAAAVTIIVATALAGELGRGAPGRRRLGLLAVVLGLGAAGAVLIPNRLSWRGESPYLQSLRGVADYESGSGRGRLVQYRRSFEMARAHPLLGVGPGNWAVAYPRFTRPGDPGFAAGQPVPTNPWPSSDWAAVASERGFPAFGLLLLAGLLLLGRGVARLRRAHARAPDAVGGLGLLTTALVIGCFDAQLLLAAPSLLIMGGLGALLPADDDVIRWEVTPRTRRVASIAIGVVGLTGVLRLGLETAAMRLYEQGGASRAAAASVDPGNYRIRALLAAHAAERGRCGEARRWADAALRRMPDAPYPRAILRRCR